MSSLETIDKMQQKKDISAGFENEDTGGSLVPNVDLWGPLIRFRGLLF